MIDKFRPQKYKLFVKLGEPRTLVQTIDPDNPPNLLSVTPGEPLRIVDDFGNNKVVVSHDRVQAKDLPGRYRMPTPELSWVNARDLAGCSNRILKPINFLLNKLPPRTKIITRNSDEPF